VAGPGLIVASVLVVLNSFVRGLMTTADVLRYWLPTYCLTGKSLAAGHILSWNPYVMGGAPFAADPQSGWMYLPAMLLFGALPCDVAIRAMIVLQPVLAGLGMLWFLRAEGLGRPAATVGGVAMALVISSSELTVSLPFAGALAWTTLLLAAVARCVRSSSWQRRLLWALGSGAAWGQLAAAHFSVGLAIGTLAAVVYLGTALARQRKAGVRKALGTAALVLGSFLLVNPAYLLPRLDYLPETNLSLGYVGMNALGRQIIGQTVKPLGPGYAGSLGWPLKLATTPGAYLAAIVLFLSFAGWWEAGRRSLLGAFAGFGVVSYVLSLRVVADRVPLSWRSNRLIDSYLHSPEWLGFGLLLSLVVMGAVGVEAWLAARPARERLWMAAPGAVVWGVLPLALGAGLSRLLLLALGAVVGGLALWLVLRRPSLNPVLACVVALEMAVAGFLSTSEAPFEPIPILLHTLPEPTVTVANFLIPGPLIGTIEDLDGGRYFFGRDLHSPPRRHDTTPGLAPNHSELFHTQILEAFNPTQLLRVWVYTRAAQHRRIKYNRMVFPEPTAQILDLFQVGWAVAPVDQPPLPGLSPAATENPWALFRFPRVAPRASVLTSWAVAGRGAGPGGAFPSPALDMVTDPGFDPEAVAVVETDPGLGPAPTVGNTPGTGGEATYASHGPQAATVRVRAPAPAVVLVRNAFDRGWHATVDGKEVDLLRTDYFLQGIPVSAGTHTIELTFDDPWVGYGLLGSALGVLALLGAALAVGRRDRVGPP
jgi:hypothetical protein